LAGTYSDNNRTEVEMIKVVECEEDGFFYITQDGKPLPNDIRTMILPAIEKVCNAAMDCNAYLKEQVSQYERNAEYWHRMYEELTTNQRES
jgi:hypothetical protein